MTPLELAAQGVAVIPCHPRTKLPAVRWSRYRPGGGRLPTAAELARWFRPGRVPALANAAAVCGWTGFAVLDFDSRDGYAAWLAWAAGRGGLALDLATEGYRVETGRGVHAYVRCDAPAPSGKLWRSAEAEARWRGLGWPTDSSVVPDPEDLWGDLKGWGQCAMLSPSVHPSGVRYQPVDASAPILRVPGLADVVPVVPTRGSPARHRAEGQERPEPYRAPAPGSAFRHVARTSDLWPESPIDRIKRAVSLLDLFPDAVPSGGGGRWYLARCPFHEDRSPSLRLDLRAGVAACFAGCLGDRGSDVIGVYARLHGLSTRQAVRALDPDAA